MYSIVNDPQLQIILRLQMIPKMDSEMILERK